MSQTTRLGMALTLAFAAAIGTFSAQTAVAPTNDAPNPYETIANYFKMPAGRTWGSTSAVEIDKDGSSIWVGERCGTNSCWDAAAGAMSPLDVVLKFDAGGTLVKSFGAGLMVFPHGIFVDRDGNIWLTDGQDNLPRRRAGMAPDAPLPPMPAKVVGHQVFKFSPDGKLLLTLGKPGGNQPGQAEIRRRSFSRTTSSRMPTATSSSPRDTAAPTPASSSSIGPASC